ncbi:hypothetical protein [Streptomyces sp. G-G2]|uniref:DUF6968 family protein n=1 Tax=Streptomyces sp. G-G2 TaxID=3046201 RepID=UPI0024B93271|nr:hypothetical protein [Streptomyces sp. G-G2]MDJ0385155.1 hypothetical protein [Streptomyces sp. G-G2]
MPDSEILGPVIASRTLEAVPESGPSFPVSLQLGTPRPDAEADGDWICPCRIEGLDDSTVYEIHGVDGLQAVSIALSVLQTQLEHTARASGLTFTWGGETGLTAAQTSP